MTDIQAALGFSQLQRLDEYIATRVALAERYDRLLAGLALALPYCHSSVFRPFRQTPVSDSGVGRPATDIRTDAAGRHRGECALPPGTHSALLTAARLCVGGFSQRRELLRKGHQPAALPSAVGIATGYSGEESEGSPALAPHLPTALSAPGQTVQCLLETIRFHPQNRVGCFSPRCLAPERAGLGGNYREISLSFAPGQLGLRSNSTRYGIRDFFARFSGLPRAS